MVYYGSVLEIYQKCGWEVPVLLCLLKYVVGFYQWHVIPLTGKPEAEFLSGLTF